MITSDDNEPGVYGVNLKPNPPKDDYINHLSMDMTSLELSHGQKDHSLSQTYGENHKNYNRSEDSNWFSGLVESRPSVDRSNTYMYDSMSSHLSRDKLSYSYDANMSSELMNSEDVAFSNINLPLLDYYPNYNVETEKLQDMGMTRSHRDSSVPSNTQYPQRRLNNSQYYSSVSSDTMSPLELSFVKTHRKNLYQAKDCYVFLKILATQLVSGTIIGRGGKGLNWFRRKSKVDDIVLSMPWELYPKTEYRTLLLKGTLKSVIKSTCIIAELMNSRYSTIMDNTMMVMVVLPEIFLPALDEIKRTTSPNILSITLFRDENAIHQEIVAVLKGEKSKVKDLVAAVATSISETIQPEKYCFVSYNNSEDHTHHVHNSDSGSESRKHNNKDNYNRMSYSTNSNYSNHSMSSLKNHTRDDIDSLLFQIENAVDKGNLASLSNISTIIKNKPELLSKNLEIQITLQDQVPSEILSVASMYKCEIIQNDQEDGCKDGGNANQSLFQQTSTDKDDWFTFEKLREKKPEGQGSQKDPKAHWNTGTDQYRELVEELKAVSVESSNTAITSETIAGKLALAVQNGGTKFKDLVTALKSQQGFRTGDELNKDNLKSALNQKAVKEKIKDLLKAEFGVDVLDDQIDVSKDPSKNKVVVKVKKDASGKDEPTNSGNSIVKKNKDKKIPNPIEIEVKVHEELVINLLEKADQTNEEKKKEKGKEIAGNLANRLSKASEKAKIYSSGNDYNPGKELVKEEFAISSADVTASGSNTVTVNANEQDGTGTNSSSPEKVSLKITGSSGGSEFDNLVKTLSEKVPGQVSQNSLTRDGLKNALNNVTTQIKDLVNKEFSVSGVSNAGDITVETDSDPNKVIVKIKNGENYTGTAKIKTGESTEITIEVKGDTSIGITQEKANAIASALALALVNPSVNEALKNKSVTISIPGNTENDKVTIEVDKASSNAVARRIARRLAHSLMNSITSIDMEADTLKGHLDSSTELKDVIASWVKGECGATVSDPVSSNINITAATGTGKIKVTFTGNGLTGGTNNEGSSNQTVATGSKDILVTITLLSRGWLEETGNNSKKAEAIANKIAGVVSLGALANKLKSTINTKEKLTTSNLAGGSGLGNTAVKDAIRDLVNVMYNGATVNTPINTNITPSDDTSIPNMLKVELKGTTIAPGTGSIGLDFYNNDEGKGVKVTINIGTNRGNLKENTGGKDNNAEAAEIARRLAKTALIEKLKSPGSITGISSLDATTLKNAINDREEVKTALAAVIKAFYGAEVANKPDGKKDIEASHNGGSSEPVVVTIGASKQFSELVNNLKKDSNITGMRTVSDHTQVATNIKKALNAEEVKPKLLALVQSMVGDTNRGKVNSVDVEVSSKIVNVKINGKDTNSNLGSANVEVTITSPENIQIQVQCDTSEGFTPQEGDAIAKAVALAIGNKDVVAAAKSGSGDSIQKMEVSGVQEHIDGDEVNITGSVNLKVKLHRSLVPGKESGEESKVADNIRDKIVEAVKSTNNHYDIKYLNLIYY